MTTFQVSVGLLCGAVLLQATSSVSATSVRDARSGPASGRVLMEQISAPVAGKPGTGSTGKKPPGLIDGTVRPGTTAASMDLECEGKKYTVSTNSRAGECEPQYSEGRKTGVNCHDDYGNTASASCVYGCQRSQGAGSCTMTPTP